MKEDLRNTVNKYFKDNGLDITMDPSDEEMVQWYTDKLSRLLPDLYRLLEEKRMLPEGASYHGFLKVVEFEFNKQRTNAIFGDML